MSSESVKQQNVVDTLIDPSIALQRKKQSYIWGGRITLVILVLGVWQLFSPHLDNLVFSSPLAILQTLINWFQTGYIWPNLLVTIEEIILGYALGAIAGIVLGFLLGSNEIVAGILDPILISIYGIPKIALGPLFVVWFGINLMPKVVIAGVLVFFLVFFSTYQGVREVDKNMVNVMKIMGVNKSQMTRWVILPHAWTSMFLGLKLGVPEALVGAIVGEMIVSNQGIGYIIQFASTQLDTAGVYAGLFILTVMALLANALVNRASKMDKSH